MMKNVIFVFLTVLCFTACNKENAIQEPIATSEQNEVLNFINEHYPEFVIGSNNNKAITLRNNGNGTITQNEPIRIRYQSGPTDIEVGHCAIARTQQGAHFTMHASGLTPGEEVQIAMSLGNYDENCEELPFLPVNLYFDVLLLGYETVNPAGNLNFNTFLANGDNSSPLFPWPFNHPGMIDSKQALLFVVIDGAQPEGQDLVCSLPVCQ